MAKLISIDGNIGAGKSTVLDALEERLKADGRTDVYVLREPVEQWTAIVDADGDTLLQRFYREPAKHAFVFQVHIFHTLLADLVRVRHERPDVQTIVCERSVASSRHVFAHMLRDAGHLSSIEFDVYAALFDNLVVEEDLPQHIVYMDVPVATCAERIQRRGRDGEEGITEAYLNRCEYRYHHCMQEMYKTHPEGITWIDGEDTTTPQNTMERIMEIVGSMA